MSSRTRSLTEVAGSCLAPRVSALALALAVACGSQRPLAAQEAGSVVGVVGGRATTSQLWNNDSETTDYDGLLVGAFADAVTPLPWLSLRGEGSFTRRGGDVVLDVGGQTTPGRLRMSYLTVGVHARAGFGLGPVRVYLSAGPTLDQILSSELDPVLAQVFDDEKPVVLSVTAGAGLEGWVRERIRAGVDVRLTEGLSDAYEGLFTTVRNRSVEVLLRVGVPISVLRNR